jgi:hypothetical protein
MMQTVRYLSDQKLQGRGLGSKGLGLAADYIATAFKKAGLIPGGDKQSYYQFFSTTDEQGNTHQLKSIIGVIPGSHPELAKTEPGSFINPTSRNYTSVLSHTLFNRTMQQNFLTILLTTQQIGIQR